MRGKTLVQFNFDYGIMVSLDLYVRKIRQLDVAVEIWLRAHLRLTVNSVFLVKFCKNANPIFHTG